ncbi:MAG: 4-alpha-glucanotransferase [Woeseia sp.]
MKNRSKKKNSKPLANSAAAGTLMARRRAGVCLHLTSLPGAHGIGELGAAAHRFVDFIAAAGISVWQFLPTGPTAYGDSPYQPLSSFAGNELLIDVAHLQDLGLVSGEETAPLESLPAASVDFGRLIPLKQELLQRAARRFQAKAPAALQREYRAFLAGNDDAWLHDYALFRALKLHHGARPWPEWAQAYRDRDETALREFAGSHSAELESIKVVQFLFHADWQALRNYAAERGVLLFGDMPIYIALDSADAWAQRDMLQIDDAGKPRAVAGVPPDYFSADGQLWGNPLYDWAYHEKHGYDWWIRRMRHSAAMVDVVRIDHFRGFESYWSVPAGEQTARNGRWEPGPGDRLFDALRNALGHLPIVAEDLGVITPEVEALRDRHNLPGMVVLQFEIGNPDFKLAEMRQNCVCYTGTHDNDTTLGWFAGAGNDTRSDAEREEANGRVLAITHGSAATIHQDLIRIAMQSNARLAVIPMQDFLGLGSDARFNTPGKGGENWRWRVAASDLSDGLAAELRAVTSAGKRGV